MVVLQKPFLTPGTFSIPVTLVVILFYISSSNGEVIPTYDSELTHAAFHLDPIEEFRSFCLSQERLREDPESGIEGCSRIAKKDFHPDDTHMLFILFMIVLWGSLVRTVLRLTKITLPYTVVMMLSGFVIGVLAKYYCPSMYTYTAVARITPEIILYTFLPVLIFETAFGISSHVFIRAFYQILIAALPGMIIATFLTALICYEFFHEYKWTLLQACFFGSIVSATDPVAVVAILKELGVAESLSVLIDGESLLNDGMAILLYEIFRDILQEEGERDAAGLTWQIFTMFVRIAIGGPIFGYIMAKIFIHCLSKIFNDAVVEITITLVATYLTYFLAENVLGVSGVCAVVFLGITLSSEKTCISPEILEEVHEFWEMLSYLANTLLFFITGIIITERGTRDLSWTDVWYLLFLYFSLTFVRLIMLLILTPLLSRTGYGMTWQNLMVMVWGGLRGAVGVCLSLSVYEDPSFCSDFKLGPKVLFQTAGIVVLTLLINGTTTKKLLDMLKLTAVSVGQREEMEIAVKHLMDAQQRAILMLKHDRFLADANWTYINQFTLIEDPYRNALLQEEKSRKQNSSLMSLVPPDTQNECPVCQTLVEPLLSNDELRILTEDGRLKILKAMKISYWSQFAQGLLSEDAVKILANQADEMVDQELLLTHTSNFAKYWKIDGVIPFIRGKLVDQFGNRYTEPLPPEPDNLCRLPFWYIATRPGFENLMMVIVVINMVPAIWEMALEADSDAPCTESRKPSNAAFIILNWIFTGIYMLEFLLKVIGRGCGDYIDHKWNWLDFLVLIVCLVDIVLSLLPCYMQSDDWIPILHVLRYLRIIRSFRLLKTAVPTTIELLNNKINVRVFLGFNISSGYIIALDDVLRYIPHMVENKKICAKLKEYLENEHMAAVKEFGSLQKQYPGISLAVKTRHSSRAVLNQMRNSLKELRQDGLLDVRENELLTIEIEERMKKLWSSPAYITPASPELLVANLRWIFGSERVKKFVLKNAQLKSFSVGEVIADLNEDPTGIHVIVSGIVRLIFSPTQDMISDRLTYGCIPNMEIFKNFEFDKHEEDIYTSGTVIGESGTLTRRKRSARCVIETDGASAYFIPMDKMDEAFATFNDPATASLESRLWRSCGIRRGIAYFPTTYTFKNWSTEKIQVLLEKSCVPIGPQFATIEILPYIIEVFLIEGLAKDADTGEIYVAPELIPKTCKNLEFPPNEKTVNRVLVITHDHLGQDVKETELTKCVIDSFNYRPGYIPPDDDMPDASQFSIAAIFGRGHKKHRNSVGFEDSHHHDNKDSALRKRFAAGAGGSTTSVGSKR